MFHFTIRDVLWLTVVVAIGAGWAVREASFRKFHSGVELHVGRLEFAIERGGYEVLEDDQGPFLSEARGRRYR